MTHDSFKSLEAERDLEHFYSLERHPLSSSNINLTMERERQTKTEVHFRMEKVFRCKELRKGDYHLCIRQLIRNSG